MEINEKLKQLKHILSEDNIDKLISDGVVKTHNEAMAYAIGAARHEVKYLMNGSDSFKAIKSK